MGGTSRLGAGQISVSTPNYRAVGGLREIEELSNEEAALIRNEPVSSVKSRLHRARMALREQLTLLMTAAQISPAR